jgi:MSHA biogenesis protein MshO
MRTKLFLHKGFTLVEMIMVIVITGILGGMVAVFINAPVRGYIDSGRRAEMTDAADTALRRLGRDVRTAVPNSIRTAGCGVEQCVEYLPTRVGGRYRASGPGDTLNFGIPDGVFDIIGTSIVAPMNFLATDSIVIGSTQSDGNPPYDISDAGILRAYTGAAGGQTVVTMTANPLPVWAELQTQRFSVVDGTQQAVTYACQGLGIIAGDGTGVLNRYALYGYRPAQASPAALFGGGAVPAVLVNNLSACTITYNPVSQLNGLLEVALTITRGNENVSLYHAIHVNNIP